MLGEVFSAVLNGPLEVERDHQSPVKQPTEDQPPQSGPPKSRPVIVKLLRFQVKDAIIREARAKRGTLKFRGHSLSVFEDYPPEVADERKTYSDAMSDLWKMGLKPSLRYPAQLSIKLAAGGRRKFASLVEAQAFIASQTPDQSAPADNNRPAANELSNPA